MATYDKQAWPKIKKVLKNMCMDFFERLHKKYRTIFPALSSHVSWFLVDTADSIRSILPT
jgi:hypothetical protein